MIHFRGNTGPKYFIRALHAALKSGNQDIVFHNGPQFYIGVVDRVGRWSDNKLRAFLREVATTDDPLSNPAMVRRGFSVLFQEAFCIQEDTYEVPARLYKLWPGGVDLKEDAKMTTNDNTATQTADQKVNGAGGGFTKRGGGKKKAAGEKKAATKKAAGKKKAATKKAATKKAGGKMGVFGKFGGPKDWDKLPDKTRVVRGDDPKRADFLKLRDKVVPAGKRGTTVGALRQAVGDGKAWKMLNRGFAKKA